MTSLRPNSSLTGIRCCRGRIRRGLSLMEIIMAISILGIAMAIIGNLVFLGAKSAGKSKWLSEAQILCDTKMAEVSAGVLSLESVSINIVEENPDWVYSVEVSQSDLPGLLSVTVTVQPNPGRGASFSPVALTRMMPDPNYVPEESMLQ